MARGSSGKRHGAEITEKQHDEAIRVLRAEYYQSVRGIVASLAEAVESGEISDRDGFEQRIDEEIDSSYWVIYTHANHQVLFVSDNADGWIDDFGTEGICEKDGIDWARLAYGAMRVDVRQLLDAEGVEPEWED